MDPGRFHSGRWFLLADGVLVSALGIAGLISAVLHPHAGPTGAPVLGLSTTPAHSAILLVFGLAAIGATAKRRAAVIVTALSAIAYFMLLFFGSVATARAKPTPLGFHAADIVLHGVLGVVSLGLLMWFIPDELGDEVWGPRRGRGRDRRGAASEAVDKPAESVSAASAATPAPPPALTAAPTGESAAHESPPPQDVLTEQPRQKELSTSNVQNSPQPTRPATRAADAVPSHRFVPMAVAVVIAVVGVVIWVRRRR